MVKLVYCVSKQAEISDDEFHRYWHEKHGPLVKTLAAAIGAKRYIQSHTIAPPINILLQSSRGLKESYDGITEVWFDSEGSVEQVLANPAAQDALGTLIEDESTFVDFAKSTMFLTEEYVIFDNQPS